jgi:hypothetical protein
VTEAKVFDGPVPPRAATPPRVWYRRPASQTALLAVLVVLLPMYITILIAGVAGSVKIGLILGGIELLLGAVVLAALSPLIMLRGDEVRIWHGFRFTNIGISDIAGVGMLYAHTAGYGGSWRLFIWRDDGSIEGTSCTYLLGRSPRLAPGTGRWNWARQANYDPVASSEVPALDASRAATVGRDICKRVLAAQGPDGQLATRHREKHQPPIRIAPYTQLIAYWSPDGQTGHCR